MSPSRSARPCEAEISSGSAARAAHWKFAAQPSLDAGAVTHAASGRSTIAASAKRRTAGINFSAFVSVMTTGTLIIFQLPTD
jgi:hypothetical protein